MQASLRGAKLRNFNLESLSPASGEATPPSEDPEQVLLFTEIYLLLEIVGKLILNIRWLCHMGKASRQRFTLRWVLRRRA